MSSSDRHHDQGQDTGGRPDHEVGEAGGCGQSCESCSPEQRLKPPEQPSGPFRGWSLAGVAAFYFLVPIALALVGAALTRSGTDEQALAAVAGLALGVLLTTSTARLWTRRRSIEDTDDG